MLACRIKVAGIIVEAVVKDNYIDNALSDPALTHLFQGPKQKAFYCLGIE